MISLYILSVKGLMLSDLDEATPHLHIDFVPFIKTDGKRGLETRVSLKQALKAQGFVGVHKKDSGTCSI